PVAASSRPSSPARLCTAPSCSSIHSAPSSAGSPLSRRVVNTRPPTRSRASRTTDGIPQPCSRKAALSPAKPAPTTTTRGEGGSEETGLRTGGAYVTRLNGGSIFVLRAASDRALGGGESGWPHTRESG